MNKTDFIRTPDGSQRIVDANFKASLALYIPVFEDDNSFNGNPDEAGPIGINSSGQFTYYDGTDWQTPAVFPVGGTTSKYLRGDGTWQTLDTAAVPENTNLYYTAARFNTAFGGKTTADLAEGSNLYYTAARFNTAFSGKSTTDLSEGTNKYYTDARVQTYGDAHYPQLSSSYSNPSWITALAQSKITYTGTTAQYVRGDGSFATFPTAVSSFTNDSGYLTSNQTITLSGDVSGSGSTSITVAIGANKVLNSMLQNSTISGVSLGGSLAALSQGTGITAFSYTGAGAATVVIDQSFAPTWSGVHTFSKTVATTPADAVIVSNPTAAANGAQQYSPGVNLQANGWGTTAGTSQPLNWRFYATATQSTVPTSTWNVDYSVNGGAYTNIFQMSSSGTLTINGGGGTIAAGPYNGNISALATTSTDGGVFTNRTAATSGVPVQYSPRIRIGGRVWNTTATAASNQYDWGFEARGISGTTPTSTLYFMKSLVTNTTPSFSDVMNLTDGGVLTTTSYIASGASAMQSSGTFNACNFSTSGTGSQSSTNAGLLFSGASTIYTRSTFNGGSAATPAANAGYGAVIFGKMTVTLPASGTTPYLAQVVINDFGTITNASSIAVTGATLLYLGTGPSVSGAVNSAIYINAGDILSNNGNVKLGTAGNGLYIKEGSNATMGTGTLVAGTLVVSTTKVTANSRILLGNEGGGVLANVGVLTVSARSAGTSFTVTSSNALDTANFVWVILEPA